MTRSTALALLLGTLFGSALALLLTEWQHRRSPAPPACGCTGELVVWDRERLAREWVGE